MAIGTRVLTWFDGKWAEGNTPIMGAADHGTWQGTLVFDGARSFEGVAPDLDLHCQRIVNSARTMAMDPVMAGDEIAALVREGIAKFPPDMALYLRPMMWSTEASPALIDAVPGSTRMAICLEDLPLADPANGISLTVSSFRRPRQDTAMTEAKAACLYPNNARIVAEAKAKGFMNALSLDLDGYVAETASTNVFMVRDGVVQTPVPNGTFLAGITRARVIGLLRDDGYTVEETSLTVDDFQAADEIFLTGNASKVMPVSRLDERELQPGPVFRAARRLYWDFAHDRMRGAA